MQALNLALLRQPGLTNRKPVMKIRLAYSDVTRLTFIEKGLSELDLSCDPNLGILCVNYNQLTELDLSHTPNLRVLRCLNNQLTSLNLTSTSNLEILEISGNNLTELDLSNVPDLIELG